MIVKTRIRCKTRVALFNRTHTLLGSRSPDAVQRDVGGCVRAPSAADSDCNLQLLAQCAALASPAPRLLSTQGFYWPSIRFLCDTHLHSMKAVWAQPFAEDSLPSRHYGMSLFHYFTLRFALMC